MTNSWDNVVLPPGYAYSFSGGPGFDTRIVSMDGGGEQRVQTKAEPTWRWSAMRRNFRDGADVRDLIRFFLSRRGAVYGFLFIDPMDYSTNPTDDSSAPAASDQVIGYGDGSNQRFRLYKTYRDQGGVLSRDFTRRIIPLEGSATAAEAALFGISEGDSLDAKVYIDGIEDPTATFLPISGEVSFTSAPASGAAISWSGRFAVPARFSANTEASLESTIAGFQADEASFEIQSISFDDPTPISPGGNPCGYVELDSQSSSFEISGVRAAIWDITPTADISAFLDDLTNYPTGGKHLTIINRAGSNTITLYDYSRTSVGTIGAGEVKSLYVKENNTGNRTGVLI